MGRVRPDKLCMHTLDEKAHSEDRPKEHVQAVTAVHRPPLPPKRKRDGPKVEPG